MNIRESMEERELELLSPYAAYSGRSREETGRKKSVTSGRFTRETGTGSCIAKLFAG